MKVVGGLAQMWGHEGFANQLLCRDSGAAPNSFAHDSPNNPGLRATRCLEEPALVPQNLPVTA